MASGKRSGFGGWDKGYCDVGLGLKIQRQQHQQHQQQQQQPNETFSSGASMREMMPWQHGRSDYTASEHNNCSTTSSSRSPSPSTSFISGFPQTTSFFSNQDGVLAASDHHREGTRVVFTAGQRQELERQTIIYKYMMASMPVPPELLVPLSKYPSSGIYFYPLFHFVNLNLTHNSVWHESDMNFKFNDEEEVGRRAGKNGLELRYTSTNSGRGGGGDAEPWRCRRTDGKKWRCSRDVAPDQKYCERHSHKGRPSRSRKPVESLVISPLPNSNIKPPSSSASSASNSTIFSPFNKPSSFDLPSHLSHYTTQPSRFPEWFMKKEVLPATLYPGQIEQFGGDIREGDGDATHFDSKRAVTDQTCMLPRPFIDAWSLGDVHKDANPTSTSNAVTLALPTEVTTSKDPTSSRINSVLPLTLSMSAGIDYDSIHDTPKDHVIRDARSSHQQPLNWMTSWIGSPPGGPLAEALCLGISGNAGGLAAHSDDLVSPHGHSTGSSTTTMGSKSSNASVETSGQGFHLH